MIAPSGLQNLVGLVREELELLRLTLQELHAAEPELGQRLIVYLLDGRDSAVLDDLSQLPNIARLLRLTFMSPRDESAEMAPSWRRFLERLKTRNPLLLLRLGKMLEAAIRNLPPAVLFCQQQLDNNRWLEMLLQEATRSIAISMVMTTTETPLSANEVIQMLAAAERTPAAFITAPFRPDTQWNSSVMRSMIVSLDGIGTEWARFAQYIRPLLLEGGGESRLRALETLIAGNPPWEPFVRELVDCATDGAKALRDTAEPVLREVAPAARATLEKVAREAETARREQAVRLIARYYGSEAREFLQSLLPSEATGPVREQLEAALRDMVSAESPEMVRSLTPPQRSPVDLRPPVSRDLRSKLEAVVEAQREAAREHHERLRTKKPNDYVYPTEPMMVADDTFLDRLSAALETGEGLLQLVPKETAYGIHWSMWYEALRAVAVHPDCQVAHIVRLLHVLGPIRRHGVRLVGGITEVAAKTLDAFREAHSPKATLEDIADVLRAADLPEELLLDASFEEYIPMFDWEADACWPFLARHVDRLERSIAPIPLNNQAYRQERMLARERTLIALRKFPMTPPKLVAPLWDLAVASTKKDRSLVQPICDRWNDLLPRLTTLLASSQPATRAIAAEWLGRRKESGLAELLLAAARKETNDVTLDAMLNAIERQGGAVDEFLDLDRLQADAAKHLRNGPPKTLGWFPWKDLPTVRWRGSQKEVPRETLQWLIVQSVKLKSPEAGASLRRYCARMEPSDRERFGEFVLDAWIRGDLQPKLPLDEAIAYAKKRAPDRLKGYETIERANRRGDPDHEPYHPLTLPAVEQEILEETLADLGSKAADKGMLAVASACCGDAAASHVQAYVEQWCSKRAPQCKSLIAMLAGVDSPEAIRCLLSMPSQIRAAKMRGEVEALIATVAERNGWTEDELADRSMPTYGFDEQGRLLLSYGIRAFVARLKSLGKLELLDAEGKVVKALPPPTNEDDRELAELAKKRWNELKKQVAKSFETITNRLARAAQEGHEWTSDQWETFWKRHPLGAHVARLFVWCAVAPDGTTTSFTQGGDGTLRDETGEPWQIQPHSRIRVMA